MPRSTAARASRRAGPGPAAPRGCCPGGPPAVPSPGVIQVRDLVKHYRVHQRPPGVAAALRSVFHRTYQTVRAVDGLSFSVAPGERIGFLGPNGAGKTTLIKLLTGLYQPTGGEVRVDGTPVRAWELDPDSARHMIDTNLIGVINGVAAVLPSMLARGQGAIAVVASVAGYHGLPNALVYGATKAALINFCETLHLDLAPRGIDVFLINPGFVETPLTAQNRFRMPALISADEAARHIADGFEAGRFEIHFPKRFTRWLKLLAMLPYGLSFRAIRRMTKS